MTLSIPFFTALRTWFGTRQEIVEAAPAPATASLQKLHRMLVVTGERANACSCKLVATEIGESQLVFKTNTPIRERELLAMDLLLPGVGSLKVTGHVDWVLHSALFYSGQLTLLTSPEQRILLAEFIRRQREGRR